MKSTSIVRGTVLITAASLLSKILGILYVIPFNYMVGEEGAALFTYAYVPYSILLSISTVGIPLGMSKFLSKYNSLGQYDVSFKMFKLSMVLMSVTGIITFLIMFAGSDLFSTIAISNNRDSSQDQSITQSDVSFVIQMVSFALLIIPSMSLVRGFFQGHGSMVPTAVSQVIEQLVRIIFLLVSVYFIINVLNESLTLAVGSATFSAFIGAIASCLVLGGYWKKRISASKLKINQEQSSVKPNEFHSISLFRELFYYSSAFVLVGIANPLYQIIDQMTFDRAMVNIGQGDISQIALGVINLNGHKLVIIPVTVAIGLSMAIIPSLTKAFVDNNKAEVINQINQSFQIILVVVVPAFVGLSILHNEAYGAFFGINNIEIAGPLLAWYAPVSLLFSLFTITAAILQGINRQQFTIVSLSVGLILKAVLNIPFIYTFGAKGAIIGTMLGVGAASLLNIWKIKTSIHFSLKPILKRSLFIIILTLLMGFSIIIIRNVLEPFVNYENGQFDSALALVIYVTVSGGLYLLTAYKTKLLQQVVNK
ncbi:polysaccharide biosynthesis protein [Halobacillus sp. A5]|uniref:putative polysaccharide biosynthesis protein n=1 Tax=Halobacillus sp. A5 TaxID=2880263 RepID=UPI0020A65DB3|nr:polysaccharide biosynthesis protein [Halobacillus sp. A5]MCP3027078.1 polysaccharide biosynthesis protein [Halobacillus sp. A5]